MDDRELVSRMIALDEEAWAECVRRYSSSVKAGARSTCKLNSADLDDCFQTVFLKLRDDDCRRLRKWRGPDLAPYLRAISRHVALDFVRLSRLPDPPDNPKEPRTDAADPLEVLIGTDRAAFADEAAREGLNQRDFDAYRRFRRGESRSEIAPALGITENNVGVILNRAVRRIRQALKDRGKL